MSKNTELGIAPWSVASLAEDTIPLLEEAYYSEWRHETLGDDALARKIARYFCAHLANQTNLSDIYIYNHRFAGVVLARINSQPITLKLLPEYDEAALEAEIKATELGRKSIFLCQTIFKLNETLRQNAAQNGRVFDAELLFLFVAKRHRRGGLGRQMVKYMQGCMERAGVKNFCLFTDTNCNWQYYMKEPWVKEGELPWPEVEGMAGGREMMFSRTL